MQIMAISSSSITSSSFKRLFCHNLPSLVSAGTKKTRSSVSNSWSPPVPHCLPSASSEFSRICKDQSPWRKWVEKFQLNAIFCRRILSSHLRRVGALPGDLEGFPRALMTERRCKETGDLIF